MHLACVNDESSCNTVARTASTVALQRSNPHESTSRLALDLHRSNPSRYVSSASTVALHWRNPAHHKQQPYVAPSTPRHFHCPCLKTALHPRRSAPRYRPLFEANRSGVSALSRRRLETIFFDLEKICCQFEMTRRSLEAISGGLGVNELSGKCPRRCVLFSVVGGFCLCMKTDPA